MFSQYCTGCRTKEDCFENGYCIKERFEDLFDLNDNIAEVSPLSESELINEKISHGEFPVFKNDQTKEDTRR